MKPNIATRRSRRLTPLLGILSAVLLWPMWSTAHADATDPPELSIVGATGVPGSTVSVTFALTSNTDGVAVGAQANINFDATVLDFFGQFAASQCTVGSCVGTNQIIAGAPMGTGVLVLKVAPNPSIFPEVPFPTTCTNIASCQFHIKDSAQAGTTTLAVSDPILTNSTGGHLDVTTGNGTITIANATPTPTPTITPVAPTATATHVATPTNSPMGNTPTATPTTPGAPTNTPTTTPTGTPSETPTSSTPGSPTVTNTVGATSTATVSATPTHGEPTSTATNTISIHPHIKDSDSCNIVAPEQSSPGGGLALLLVPALLVWVRRRF